MEEKTAKNEYLDIPIWYLEYSPSQKCFHVDSIDQILQNNRDAAMSGRRTDWIIIAGPTDHDNAFLAIKTWVKKVPYRPVI